MPNNRPLKKLWEISLIFADWDWIESKDQSQSWIRLIQTWNVWSGFFKNREEKWRYISEDTFKRLNCTEIFENDCLISRLPDPVGRACIIPKLNDKLITVVDCTIIRFDEKQIYSKYFIYYSQSNLYQNDIERECAWATRKRISRKKLWEIKIPLPPLATQKAIVAKLDETFAQIDEAITTTKTNIKSTDEFTKSVLDKVFEKGEWEKVIIWKIANIKSWKRLPKGFRVQDQKTEYPYIRVSDFWEDGTIDSSNIRYITKEVFDQISRYIITDQDLYISIAGTIWKTWIIPSALNWASLTENAIRLVYKEPEKIYNNYILYFTKSSSFIEQAWLATRAVAMPKLAISRLGNIQIPLPTLAKQKEIVAYLEQVFAQSFQLKAQYQDKLAELKALKASVLQSAFEGKLI